MARLSRSLVLIAAALAGTFAAPTGDACRCQGTWLDNSGSCGDAPIEQHGCPTLAELQRCDATKRVRTCKTTQPICAGQFGIQTDLFEYCEIENSHQRSVLKTISENVDDSRKCMTAVPPATVNDTVKIYDLTPLHKLPVSSLLEDNWQAFKRGKEGHEDRQYLLNVCGPLANLNNGDGRNAYEMNLNAPDGDTDGAHVLGRFANTSLTSVHDGDLRMIMPGGQGANHSAEVCPQRQTLIIFFCDEPSRENPLGAPFFVDEFNTCEYVFVWNSCAACPLGHKFREKNCGVAVWEDEVDAGTGFFGGRMNTMSPGSALLITLSICFGLYLVIGTAYNRLIVGERGVKQLPNFDFWAATCRSIARAPGYLYGVVAGRPQMNKFSDQSRFAGLIDDSDEEEVDDDAENHEYD